jgi:hypothetical protein
MRSIRALAVAGTMLVSSLALPSVAAAADTHLVPISGVESYNPDPSGGTIPCSGLEMPRVFLMHGRFTHLGESHTTLTVDTCGLTSDGLAIGGHAVRTAANGDQLFVSWQEVINPETGAESGTARFTGGSGRFAGATGSGAYKGMIDLVTLHGTFELRGMISAVGTS